jgi:hypothetical protein
VKKLLFGLIAIVLLFSNDSFGQTSSHRAEGKDTFVESFEVKSDINTIITEVKITNKNTNVTLPSFIYKFKSYGTTDVKKDFATNPNGISGMLTIEIDGQIIYKRELKKGVFEKPEIIDFIPTSVLGKKYPCTIRGNFQCAVDRVNAMNLIDYAFCAITAPACLAQTHLSCAWDNC